MMQFIGHLHPVIVHLPIGILLLGAFLMIYQGKHDNKYDQIISLAFLLGSSSAVLACITGWLLAQSGEYDEVILQKHQWIGIVTAIIGWSCYLIEKYRKILVVVLVVLLILAGHFGSTLTHGENYLFSTNKKEEPVVEKKNDTTKKITPQIILNGKDSISIVRSNIYKEEIKPLLQTRCISCHGSLKQKGGLRLDNESFIKKGGKNGLVLVAGDLSKSIMYTNMLLPLEDEKHMPPKGKHQLSATEIAIIKKWIVNGASFEDKVDTVKNTHKVIRTDSVAKMIPKKEDKGIQPAKSIAKTIMPNPVKKEVFEFFKNKNVLITPTGENATYVMANFVNDIPFNNNDINDLKIIKEQLTVLKLSNLPIKDIDIKIIADFKNITKLNLENTAITDVSITYLKQLPKLEQLNLYGTNITDESLKQLSLYKNLAVLYLWKTKVTQLGVESFMKIKPNVKVEIGNFKFQQK
jgi:uncharacterized membrane protein